MTKTQAHAPGRAKVDGRSGRTRQRSFPKAATGIKGLDEITNGGLPRRRATLVCGGPGCGKTLLGTQFLVHGATIAPSHGAEYFLAPSNGHLQVLGKLIYRAIFEVFGADYAVFRAFDVAGDHHPGRRCAHRGGEQQQAEPLVADRADPALHQGPRLGNCSWNWPDSATVSKSSEM